MSIHAFIKLSQVHFTKILRAGIGVMYLPKITTNLETS
jgi:hypothetical protein